MGSSVAPVLLQGRGGSVALVLLGREAGPLVLLGRGALGQAVALVLQQGCKAVALVLAPSKQLPQNNNMGRIRFPIIFSRNFISSASTAEVQEAQLGRLRGGPSRAREGQEVGGVSERAVLGEADNDHVKLYQHSSMVINLQTNVPEPFEPKVEEQLKEGLPIGLSDAQINLDSKSSMEIQIEQKAALKL